MQRDVNVSTVAGRESHYSCTYTASLSADRLAQFPQLRNTIILYTQV